MVEDLLPLLCQSKTKFFKMKYSEFHRIIKKNGWTLVRISKHYIYEKDGRTYPVPFHGSKEMAEPLRKQIIKEMGLK